MLIKLSEPINKCKLKKKKTNPNIPGRVTKSALVTSKSSLTYTFALSQRKIIDHSKCTVF